MPASESSRYDTLLTLSNCRRARGLALRYSTLTSLKAGHYETLLVQRGAAALADADLAAVWQHVVTDAGVLVATAAHDQNV